MSDDPPRKEQQTANSWAVALGAGSELVVCALAGFFAGQWLDGKFGTGPWLMLLGAISGISIGLYRFISVSTQRGNSR
ncbi:MAG: hypothetical protein A3J74_07680 [Elusimicrobia bacterium RIFCSPHIGHO2_02_FULL_57_9]|nr:MAG: hypothetical protein A3J74_07680 [Elusimicrobia bacterium RIFCSPHIGHO2_02_FULL_57_9]